MDTLDDVTSVHSPLVARVSHNFKFYAYPLIIFGSHLKPPLGLG